MNPILNLPLAYWANVPWWALTLVVTIVAILSTPFAIQLLRGRASAYASREQILAQRAATLEKLREDTLAEARRAEIAARAELTAERGEFILRIRRLENELADTLDRGRNLNERAHELRHELIGVIQRFNGLLQLLGNYGKGLIATERAALLFQEIAPLTPPPPLPPFKPRETRKS